MSKTPTTNYPARPHDAPLRAGATGTDWKTFDALTDEQAIAAALSDPDNPPLTDQQLMDMRRIARVKRIRWALKLSQEAFAARYHIPVQTINDWERHVSEPDEVAMAYLDVIAADPEGVIKARQRDTNGSEQHRMAYHTFMDANGKWRWHLRTPNGKIIAASSEGYENESDCVKVIELVKQSATAEVA